MDHNQLIDFEASLVGQTCSIRRRENDWVFDFKDGVTLAIEVPWRIVSNGRIAFASEDHGHVFGRTSPVSGEHEAAKLLSTKPITSAVVDRQTADLTLHFDPATRIDLFNNSSGYEGWAATYAIGNKRWSAIALGGGEVTFVAESD